MKPVQQFPYIYSFKFLLFALMIVTAGCSLEKQNGFNRSMQNLTAHYNILFNAKEILRKKQESYAIAFVDNYNEILSVYPDTIAKTTTADKDLDNAVIKANSIISLKEQSHYLGDAYLVLGKANFLSGNYFSAVEYFSYVVRSFPQREDLTQDALAWKARSLLYLNQYPEAKVALDTAIKNINPKKSITADVYAAKLQYDINVQDYVDGEAMGKLAVQFCDDKMERLRWTFILSQLEELNHQQADAFKNYTTIARSNAAFEMAFNASLNRIRIEDAQNGLKTSRTDRLLSLLKDPNNKEFKDQIYYQVAELQMAANNIDAAVKYYKLSVRSSVRNQNQKGLSYLRLAQISFKNKADYISAKKYYDSTLTTLPVNYPGYRAIQKIGSNLQVLADRMQTITREDTLQALAKMDEKTRSALIDKMVSDRILQQQASANALLNSVNDVTQPGGPNVSGSSFYFYNVNSVSQGYADFKQRWGNRKLEDNWRRSNRSNSDITSNSSGANQSIDPFDPANQLVANRNAVTAAGYRQELLRGLPLTAGQVAQSNLRIYNAYVDIANFYRDIIGDKKEAINEYQLILKRFPDDANKPAIYYNLYRLYADTDPARSDQYKNLLLKNYPETAFAKVIADPDYVKKLDDKDAEFTQAYNKVFDLYASKKYKDVISGVPVLMLRYPNNKFAAQLYYLKTIAEGHGETAQPFEDSLKQIVTRYPNERLIVPLVNQHLAYMNLNHDEMMGRSVGLTDDDPHDVPFTLDNALKKETEIRHAVTPYNTTGKQEIKPIEKPKPVIAQPVIQPKTIAAVQSQAVQAAKPPTVAASPPNKQVIINKTPLISSAPVIQPMNGIAADPMSAAQTIMPSIFTMLDSTNYYFVVNVSSATTNLSSSRFGIGQFNRVNYTGKGIKHQLIPIGEDNQLIYVGRFFTLEDVKKYARAIVPLLPDIMKVQKDKYSFFIITQENLNKLADKKTLDSYMDYYQKNY